MHPKPDVAIQERAKIIKGFKELESNNIVENPTNSRYLLLLLLAFPPITNIQHQ